MGYQTFPWKRGDSDSFAKLLTLMLPSLKDKRVLDVGCNSGFFCGWAAFQKASYVKGIDKNPECIAQAKEWFPACDFECASWDDLDDQKYDVVLCLSALQFAHDQQSFIHGLMRKVDVNGALVLELGIAPGQENTFHCSEYAGNVVLYPTFAKIASMLSQYTFKVRNHIVTQNGRPIQKYVLYVQHRKPYAILLIGESYSGKTSFSRNFKGDIPRIVGDRVLGGFITDLKTAPQSLLPVVANHTVPVNYGEITNEICSKGLLVDYLKYLESLAGGKDFILDAYFEQPFKKFVRPFFESLGYLVVEIDLAAIEMSKSETLEEKYEYLQYLQSNCLVSEMEYCAANPDVAAAIAAGRIPNAQFHYYNFGRREGRKVKN